MSKTNKVLASTVYNTATDGSGETLRATLVCSSVEPVTGYGAAITVERQCQDALGAAQWESLDRDAVDARDVSELIQRISTGRAHWQVTPIADQDPAARLLVSGPRNLGAPLQEYPKSGLGRVVEGRRLVVCVRDGKHVLVCEIAREDEHGVATWCEEWAIDLSSAGAVTRYQVATIARTLARVMLDAATVA